MDGSNGIAPPSVQAHLVRASKYHDKKTKNWSLFFFFRIMKQQEIKATSEVMQEMIGGGRSPPPGHLVKKMEYGLENAALARSIGGDEFREAARQLDLDAAAKGVQFDRDAVKEEPAADAFYSWLGVVTAAKKEAFIETTQHFFFGKAGEMEASKIQSLAALFTGVFKIDFTQIDIEQAAISAVEFLQQPAKYVEGLSWFGSTPEAAGLKALQGGLASMFLYEVLREGAPAFARAPAAKPSKEQAADAARPVIRSELEVGDPGAAPLYDRVPINFAFTFSGLSTLELHKATLASFPDDFKQGMAARAKRLGDNGASAPENWEGELGQKTVHGFFTGGFAIDDSNGVDEAYWRKLRADVRLFNDPTNDEGRALRRSVNALARLLGLEIVHVELGQDPYTVDDKTDRAHRLPYRFEHFGFRDGISQPFVDMNLGDQSAGHGTPGRNKTWAPVAPGEIYLDCVDEDGAEHMLPVNPDLRRHGTYLVFRKLEQDVLGLRTFVAKQRPANPKGQEALAAQFVGRWRNGTPLVLSPDAPRPFKAPKGAAPNDPRLREEEAALNDFRYATDDPRGRKCPLGSHIRRANPRDIGGRNDVRRHRILRRGMSYGGPLLPEDSLGDGEKRGMLFIAANARLDMQFETIQAEWINTGEFMGQAGLGRCPLTGAHTGKVSDTFLEAGALTPINGLPSFVRTLGGDYFFAPGVETLRMMADKNNKFPPPQNKTPYDGYSANDAITPALFDASRVQKYAALILRDVVKAVRVELPPPPPKPGERVEEPKNMVFVAKFNDVQAVLRGQGDDFSVAHYRAAMEQMTRGGNYLVGTDFSPPTGDQRTRMKDALIAAWGALGEPPVLEDRVRKISQQSLDTALRRCASTRNVDLVRDFGAEATYAILDKLLGVPGPNWVSELAMALPFARSNIGGIHEEWLAALKRDEPERPAFVTSQIWSLLVLADLIGNVQNVQELKDFSRKAAQETLTHIDGLLSRARAKPTAQPRTLLEAFVTKEPSDPSKLDEYYRDAALLLAELASTALTVVPLTFASVMTTVFNLRLDLRRLVQILVAEPPIFLPPGDVSKEDGLRRLIYEAERLNPNMPIRMRRCEKDKKLPEGATVSEGEWVSCIVQAATFDKFKAELPFQFSLHPYLDGPPRNLDDYFLFGAYGSNRECWGRDTIAVLVLEECLKTAGRLEGLRRIAGPRGEIRRILNIPVGLQARFVCVA